MKRLFEIIKKLFSRKPLLVTPAVNCWAFNLNHNIKVKIYDKGYQHLADNHNKYLGTIRNWEKRTPEYYKNKADENGYTTMQAWCFIEEFAEVTGWGFNGYYCLDIVIDDDNLQPCS